MLACPICHHGPKVDAHLVSCCSQSFCAKCLDRCGQKRNAVRCPYCRVTATVSKDRSFVDGLQIVRVRCKDAPCCRWEGYYPDVGAHEEACEVGKLRKELKQSEARRIEMSDAMLHGMQALQTDATATEKKLGDLQRELASARQSAAAINDNQKLRADLDFARAELTRLHWARGSPYDHGQAQAAPVPALPSLSSDGATVTGHGVERLAGRISVLLSSNESADGRRVAGTRSPSRSPTRSRSSGGSPSYSARMSRRRPRPRSENRTTRHHTRRLIITRRGH